MSYKGSPRDGRLRSTVWPVQLLMLLTGLTACSGAQGPVVGDWRGEVPDGATKQVVDLMLDGLPDAPSGHYRMAITTGTADIGGSRGTQRQDGVWRLERATDGGLVFHLLDDPAGSTDRYELGADKALHPVGKDNRADPSQEATLYTLLPVSSGLGYGPG